ncbi:MAG: alpha/beta-type small acid-soluble spore protein [Oscillospiraceae bacterium]|nr:alpha/beta-type small acid-soluble spore protein [Oscillospiraceae bacterium]
MKSDNLTAQGRETLERFKMEAANEVGVNLKNGYNGDITAREAGSVGGMMVKVMCPEQQWDFIRKNIKMMEHIHKISLKAEIFV